MRLLLALLITSLVACTAPPPRVTAPVAVRPPAATPAAEPREPAVPASLRIVILKKQRRLNLYRGDELVHSYAIGLGFTPEGPKYREGDGRTPEGEYYVAYKNPDSEFYLSLAISYPNSLDAKRAWFNGLISRDQYRQIETAIREHGTPPWNTALGGAIFIHGFGSTRDWTRGCIALNNYDVEQLFAMIPVGTPVIIRP